MDTTEEAKAKAIEKLSALFASGAVAVEQFESAVVLVNKAQDQPELARVFDTLAQVLPAFAETSGPVRKDTARSVEYIDCNASTVKKKGEWIRSSRYDIHVWAGSVVLDFRDYEFAGNFDMEIDFDVSGGSVKCIVPRDFVVMDDFESTSMSSVSNRVPADSARTGRISVTGHLSASSFTVRYK